MLIVDNLQMAVNHRNNTYESVIEAWKNSLVQMEALIKGISQHAQSGDILLALSAWHLFPDLSVVGSSMTLVRQNDSTFSAGGILTIGLEKPAVQQQNLNGVYWSLPLAHLRHYGSPVVSAQSIDSVSRSRLQLNELLQATLGSLIQGWGEAGSDTIRSVRWLANLSSIISEQANVGSKDAELLSRGDADASWLSILSAAAQKYLSSSGIDRQTANRLISLGRHHGHNFLGLPPDPMFGFLNEGSFVGLLRSEDDQIEFLRRIAGPIAQELRLNSNQIFIKYRHRCPDVEQPYYEYATAVPYTQITSKRKLDGNTNQRTIHQRWLWGGSAYPEILDPRYQQKLDEKPDPPGVSIKKKNFELLEKELIFNEFKKRSSFYSQKGENIASIDSEFVNDDRSIALGVYWDRGAACSQPWHQFVYGNDDGCALYVVEDRKSSIGVAINTRSSSQELYSLFESGHVDHA